MTDTPADDLVERLRARRIMLSEGSGLFTLSRYEPDPICQEAADAILALRQKLEEADKMRGEALHALGLMQNERDAAESALAGITQLSDSEMTALNEARRACLP